MKTILLLSLAAGVVLGQTGNRAAVRATGQFEPDGNVVYSVHVASGQDDLDQLTISAGDANHSLWSCIGNLCLAG